MEGWKETTIGNLCTKVTDGSHFSPKEIEIGYPMFSVKDMDENGFDYSAVKRVSKEDFIKMAKGDCQPKKDDVLIAKDGSYLKHVFVCKEEKEEAILSSIAILRPDKSKIVPEYFKQLLKSSSVKGMMESFVSGSALPRIVLKDFKKMKLLIPPVPAQQRIASILSPYDDLIEINNLRIKLLEQTTRELFKEWFVPMRFPSYKEVKMIKCLPEGWAVVRIDSLYKTSSGGTPSREKNDYYENGIYEWIKTGELNDTFILDTDEKISKIGLKKSSAKLFPSYTVMFAMYGNTIGQLGISTKEAATNQACCALLPLTNEFSYEFIFLTLLQNRDEIISLGMGAAQQNVNQEELKKYKILKPTPELAIKFKNIVSPMFQQIETLQRQNTHLRQIRDRLLPRLVSGKLQVKSVEPAKKPNLQLI